jgi:hypothetical protein
MHGRQCGSVYLSYGLLAFVLILASVLLLPVHKVFALLLPIAILVFFLPNLIGLSASLDSKQWVRQQLAMCQQGNSDSTIVLKNELGGIDAQAVWLDLLQGQLGLISGKKDSQTHSLKMLRSVRAVFAEEAYATSFHEGRIRIPPRFILVFELECGDTFDLVTKKRRRMDQWVETLRPHVADRLDTQMLDGKV